MNTARNNTMRPPAKTNAPSESGMYQAVRSPARAKSTPPPRAKKHTGFTHMGFRVTEDHAAIIRAAADSKHVPVSEYLRSLCLEWSASDLGITTPDTRVYDYRNVVESAARQKGMSVRQYEAHCARELATRDLGIK